MKRDRFFHRSVCRPGNGERHSSMGGGIRARERMLKAEVLAVAGMHSLALLKHLYKQALIEDRKAMAYASVLLHGANLSR